MRFCAALGAWTLALVTTVPAAAQDGAGARIERMAAELDSMMQAGMTREGVAGAAYVAVAEGRIVVSRGFGVADIASRRRVNPDSTTFGLSSTTKLLTAIAAARLARDGRLGLDDPIEPYLARTSLASRVPSVTMSMLLTHTAGYDDPTIGSAARAAGAIVPLDRHLDRSLSAPWIRPRTHTSYSNIGVALAGHILTLASGASFAALIDSTVLAPFGMRRTSVTQPLAAELERSRAIAYEGGGARRVAVPRIYFNDVPASGGFATAHDMGLLMTRLLSPASPEDSALARTLFSRRFTNHPALPGMTLGFRESADGPDVFEHGGDWQDYSNVLFLDRGAGVGFFAVFSSSEGQAMGRSLWARVRAAYGARPNPRLSPTRGPSAPVCEDQFGQYRDTRMSRGTVARLGVLTGDVREVTVRENAAAVEIDGRAYRELGGGVVRSDDGRMMAFRCAGNRATHLFSAGAATTTFARLKSGEGRGPQAAVLLVALLATIAALVLDVRRRRSSSDVADHVARWLRILAGVVALALLFAVAWFLVTTNPWEFQYGLPGAVATLLRFSPIVLIAAGLAAAITLVAVVRGKARSGVVELLVVVPVVVLVLLMVQWNLIVVRG